MSTKKTFREGLLGKKLGMTHLFAEDGSCVPVTLIQAGPCYVLQVKDGARDGYSAVQLGFEPKKQQRLTKSEIGHFSKAGKGGFYHVREMRCDVTKLKLGSEEGTVSPGTELKVGDFFSVGESVDISGTSIGRGFAGVVKRYKVGGQPATRGTHEYRRHIGAVGCRKFPGHIFKNQRMPGRMGGARVTMQNLRVIGVNPEKNILMVRGGVPGSVGALVEIRKSMRGSVASGGGKQAA